MAKLTCDTGFSMSGEDTLYCGSDGVWNAGEPICGNYYLDLFCSIWLSELWGRARTDPM